MTPKFLTSDELAEIQKRCDASTAAYRKPAHVDRYDYRQGKKTEAYSNIFRQDRPGFLIARFHDFDNHKTDSEFFVESQQDIPDLLHSLRVTDAALDLAVKQFGAGMSSVQLTKLKTSFLIAASKLQPPDVVKE